MSAKLAAVILAVGVIACILLAVRQQRVQAAHDLADVQRRVMEHDRTLWHLRAELAGRVTPTQVEKFAARYGATAAISADRYPDLLKREASAVASAASTAD